MDWATAKEDLCLINNFHRGLIRISKKKRKKKESSLGIIIKAWMLIQSKMKQFPLKVERPLTKLASSALKQISFEVSSVTMCSERLDYLMSSKHKLWSITSSTETASSRIKQQTNYSKSSEHTWWRCSLKCLFLWHLYRAMAFSTTRTKLTWWIEWEQLDHHRTRISEIQMHVFWARSFGNKWWISASILVTLYKQDKFSQNFNTDKSFGTCFNDDMSSCLYMHWILNLSMFWFSFMSHKFLQRISNHYGSILQKMLSRTTPLVLALA